MAKIDQIQMMKLVLSIHDNGSLTAASNKLNCSLPTVVRQLAMLEAHLGVILFDRTTRKIHLTDEGTIYIEAARSMVQEVENLEISLANRKNVSSINKTTVSEPSGNITITAPVMFGRMHVMPVVNAFMAKYNLVTAHVILQDNLTDLVESGIDVGFRVGDINIPNIVAIPIGKIYRVVCVSPEYFKLNSAINTPSDLKEAKCIKNIAINKGNHWKFNINSNVTKSNKLRDITVPISFTCNNIDAAISHCLAGLGVGVFLSYQVKDLIKQGLLIEVLSEYRLPSIPISIIYTETKRNLTRTRFFIDYARYQLSSILEY